MAKFKHHIFVCENSCPPGSLRGCCAEKGAPELRQALKDAIDRRGWTKIVRANQAGCLDQCEKGITMAIYPENVWYGGVRKEDVEEILDSLKHNTVVKRLLLPEEEMTGRSCEGPLP